MSGYFTGFLLIVVIAGFIYYLLKEFDKIYNRCQDLEKENKELKKGLK